MARQEHAHTPHLPHLPNPGEILHGLRRHLKPTLAAAVLGGAGLLGYLRITNENTQKPPEMPASGFSDTLPDKSGIDVAMLATPTVSSPETPGPVSTLPAGASVYKGWSQAELNRGLIVCTAQGPVERSLTDFDRVSGSLGNFSGWIGLIDPKTKEFYPLNLPTSKDRPFEALASDSKCPTPAPQPISTEVPPGPTPPPTRVIEQQPTPVPTPEIKRAFPEEIRLEEGLRVRNIGTRYGWGVTQYAKLPDGTIVKGPEAEAINLQYVKDMFAKYNNGKNLEILFYDNFSQYPFRDQAQISTDMYRHVREVGNTIEVHLGVNERFDSSNPNSQQWINEWMHRPIIAFLMGDHEALIRTGETSRGAPQELDRIGHAAKFTLYWSGLK